MNKRTVGILIFDDVEVLDFAGPFEVFSRTRLTPGVESRRSDESAPFHVVTVSHDGETITATGGLRVTPTHAFGNAPRLDIIVIPGGFGTRPLLDHTETLDWIRRESARANLTTAVCTGSLLLARAGLLHGRRATTHWGAVDTLEGLDDTISVDRDARVVFDDIITSAGVSAGMDMAFAVVEELHGADVANETARYVEYPRSR